MATVIEVDGTTREIENLTFEKLQEAVGGYVEFIPLPGIPKKWMAVNEDGRLLSLPINKAASALYLRDIVVGVAVVLSPKERSCR